MLDPEGMDQSQGLRQLASTALPHLISVLHHGDRAAEMSALWQTCNGIQRLGYPLAVLDFTAAETTQNPGLQDALEHRYGPTPTPDAGWTIIPASRGMRALQLQGTSARAAATTLSKLFSAYSVLVLYGDADALATVIQSTACGPVVAISPEMPSLLSAYNSLKQLMGQVALPSGKLVTLKDDDTPEHLGQKVAKSLQNCTMKYLKCKLQHFEISHQIEADQQSESMRRLVLQLLDDKPLSPAPMARLGPANGSHRGHSLWSH